ncbi:hypothetical protein MEN41_10795 [Dolichospermum sp. ST_con]|nr:hypothetical protein [Dolichospermum sp. ST_con]MDD1437558.1 hypothetical protein [Dolichospermum sp. ST_sed10]
MTAEMTKLDLLSNLFLELSIEDQQFISGGKKGKEDDDDCCYDKCMKKKKSKTCKSLCDDE